MDGTLLSKKEFLLRAAMMKERLKGDADLSPSDRADAVLGLEAAILYRQSGVVRHGVTKLFCEDTASLFRHLSSLKRFEEGERDFFETAAATLAGMFPPEERKKNKTKRTKGLPR